MLRLTIALLALALAGTASAGWRDLRVDASSEEAFARSLDVFKKELTPARQYVFGEALKDIWVEGTKKAQAEQREYTAGDYYLELHGLTYEQVVTVTDPTGETAKMRHDEASQTARMQRGGSPASNLPAPSPGTQEMRTQRAHAALHSAELMRTRKSGDETCGNTSPSSSCSRSR